MEKSIILNGFDMDVVFDFEITSSHVARVGRIGMRETVIDDWEIAIESVNGMPVSYFSEEGLQAIRDALENETDLIQRESEVHAYDHIADEVDRRWDERKEAMNA